MITLPLPTLSSRLLHAGDAPALAALRAEVLASLPDPDIYSPERDECTFFKLHCPPHGETIGVFDGHTLIAYAMLGLPQADDGQHLGLALGMGQAERAASAYLASCMVHPAWRSRGLQRTLLGARLQRAALHERQVCIAMVSLKNHTSRHNMLDSGMHLAWAGQIDDLRRQLLVIDLQQIVPVDSGEQQWIGSDAYDEQRAAFAAGYIGVGQQRDGDGRMLLRFARPLALAPRCDTSLTAARA